VLAVATFCHSVSVRECWPNCQIKSDVSIRNYRIDFLAWIESNQNCFWRIGVH